MRSIDFDVDVDFAVDFDVDVDVAVPVLTSRGRMFLNGALRGGALSPKKDFKAFKVFKAFDFIVSINIKALLNNVDKV